MSEINGTRVEETRAKKMETVLLFTRVFSALVFLGAFVLVISSVNPVVWNFQSFWYGLKFFIFIFELLFLLIGYAIALIAGYGNDGAVSLMESIHIILFGGNSTIMGIPVADLITRPLQLPTQQNIIDAIYAFLIIISIVIAFISGVGFLRECNPIISSIFFFSLNIVLGLAALNDKLLISLDFSGTNFFGMIFSRLVITAFLIYFSLELSLQASYVYNVIGPNVERHRRISSHIKRLREFRMSAPKTEESKEYTGAVSGKNTATSRFNVTTAFSRIGGLVGKKLFRISAEEDWDKLNLRLKNYYDRLEDNDPFISVSLSTSAYTPSTPRLLLIIFSGTALRVVALSVLSWLALNPIPVLTFLNMPESIINSVESGQPEMILLVLAPLALFFLIIGLVVRWIQITISQRLQKRQEGRIIHPVSESQQQKMLTLQPKTNE
ncbi:MAG: hypothetical protein GF308_12160 [Candidatus Heimdallarchaeota archaeon]|nr:hypothetical protein [Candidatus Heimdallarchaeota archaeon]